MPLEAGALGSAPADSKNKLLECSPSETPPQAYVGLSSLGKMPPQTGAHGCAPVNERHVPG